MTADFPAAVATEISKQLPLREAYGDALSPGMKQVGGLGEDLVKTLRLALAPFQYAAALQDRFTGFLNESVRRVPMADRIEPAPQILGPVVEGIRYEPQGTPISDMFSELLSRAFDRSRANEAHPSYPAIIRQLSEDEALLLTVLLQRERSAVYLRFEWKMDFDPTSNRFDNRVVEVDEVPRSAFRFPENAEFYIEHLGVLGLLAVLQIDNQEPITDKDNRQIGVRARNHIRLTPLGLRFMKAVSPSNDEQGRAPMAGI